MMVAHNRDSRILKQGWTPIWETDRSTGIEQISHYELRREVIETWYWLVFQGKNPEGYRRPKKIYFEKDWKPEWGCWRDATPEEVELINIRMDMAEKGYDRLEKRTFKAKGVIKEKGKIRKQVDIEIPTSTIFKLKPENIIVKKWISGEDIEE